MNAKHQRFLSTASVAAVAFAMSNGAIAATVSYNFSGIVISSNTTGSGKIPTGAEEATPTIENTMTGSVTYDPTDAVLVSSEVVGNGISNTFVFENDNGASRIEFQINDNVWQSNSGFQANVRNDTGGSRSPSDGLIFNFTTDQATGDSNVDLGSFEITFDILSVNNNQNNFLTSADLPILASDLDLDAPGNFSSVGVVRSDDGLGNSYTIIAPTNDFDASFDNAPTPPQTVPDATVFLDFDGDVGITADAVVLVNDLPFTERFDPIKFPKISTSGVTASSNLPQPVRDSIESEVQRIFDESGVNVRFTQDSGDLPDTYYKVEFGADNPELFGYAYDINSNDFFPSLTDRFDLRSDGTVAVFGFSDDPNPQNEFTAALIETTAHELGHGFGLRHVDTGENIILDLAPGDISTVAFSDVPSSVIDPISPVKGDFADFQDHNPLFHLKRYLGDQDVPLSQTGDVLVAGSYDEAFDPKGSIIEILTDFTDPVEWFFVDVFAGSNYSEGAFAYGLGVFDENNPLSIQAYDGQKFGLIGRNAGSEAISYYVGSDFLGEFSLDIDSTGLLNNDFAIFELINGGDPIKTSNIHSSVLSDFTIRSDGSISTIPLPSSLYLLLVSLLTITVSSKTRYHFRNYCK